MKLSITTQVDTLIGLQASGIIGNINANIDQLLSTGIVNCTIDFYATQNAKDKSFGKLFPVTLKQDGTIVKIVNTCSITLTEKEAMAANLPNTIYTKVAEKLSLDYSWTVVVI